MKIKIFSKTAFFLLVFFIGCYPLFFEFLLYQEQKDLESQIHAVLNEANEELGSEDVIACSYRIDDLDDIEIIPSAFPDISKDDKYLKKYWNKELNDIDSLYSLSEYPWIFTGFMSNSTIHLNNDGLCTFGIREYQLKPGFVGIKKGNHFNKTDFYNVLRKSYIIFANNSNDVNYFTKKVLGYRNDFYSYAGRFDAHYEMNELWPSSGIRNVEPIMYNGKFSGKYNYIHIDEGSCRVYIIMEKSMGWLPELDKEAVMIKRYIWYGIIELPLLILTLFVGYRLIRRRKHSSDYYNKDYK